MQNLTRDYRIWCMHRRGIQPQTWWNHLRPEGIPSQNIIISDQEECHLRAEGIPSQTRRDTISDWNKYHLRPEGIPSQTGINTISDQKEYHLRPEGIIYHLSPEGIPSQTRRNYIPSQTRRNTISDQKEYHPRQEAIQSSSTWSRWVTLSISGDITERQRITTRT